MRYGSWSWGNKYYICNSYMEKLMYDACQSKVIFCIVGYEIADTNCEFAFPDHEFALF